MGTRPGIAFSLTRLDIGVSGSASLMLLGQGAPGIALFLTGLVLSSQPFTLDRKIVFATLVGDLLRPILTACIVFSLPIPKDVAKACILIAAVPSGFFGILFAVNYRLGAAVIGSMATASTAFSILPLAIVIALLFPS